MGITLEGNATQKIVGATYKNENLQLAINIYAFIVYELLNHDNIGNIIEKYRNLSNEVEANNFFESKKPILDQFISRINMPFPDFNPDYLTIFYPSDTNRNNLLKDFTSKLFSNINNIEFINYSANFKKKDVNSSIEDCLTKEDFTFTPPSGQKTIRNLLIIDDAINKGRTLNIFLDMLFDESLIDNQTTVKLICMYSVPFTEPDILKKIKNYKEEKKSNN